jgi:hypothetical protein
VESGHKPIPSRGFGYLTFGILIGKLLADVALARAPEFPLDRFRLGRFATGDNLPTETVSYVADSEDEER